MRVFPQILSFHRGKETNAWIEMLNICDKPSTKRNLRHPLTTTPRPILRSRLGFGGIVTELSDVPFLNYVSIYQISLMKKTKKTKKRWAIITSALFLPGLDKLVKLLHFVIGVSVLIPLFTISVTAQTTNTAAQKRRGVQANLLILIHVSV